MLEEIALGVAPEMTRGTVLSGEVFNANELQWHPGMRHDAPLSSHQCKEVKFSVCLYCIIGRLVAFSMWRTHSDMLYLRVWLLVSINTANTICKWRP